MGAQLLVVLLPAGALFGLGAAWVVIRASHGKAAWLRALSVLVVLLACMVAPVILFAALGAIALYTQPKPGASAPASVQPFARLEHALRPNPSIEMKPDRVGIARVEQEVSMHFRPGNPNDTEAIAALIASFQSELTDARDGSGAENYLASVSRHAERGYLESPRYTFIVAERESDMLGFIALRDVSHVFHLFVAREHQRTGVACRLWQEAERLALQTHAVRQFTVNSSLRAVATYRAFGFRPVGEVVSMHGISFLPMRLDVPSNEP